jgi:hypothetical protein
LGGAEEVLGDLGVRQASVHQLCRDVILIEQDATDAQGCPIVIRLCVLDLDCIHASIWDLFLVHVISMSICMSSPMALNSFSTCLHVDLGVSLDAQKVEIACQGAKVGQESD